MTSLLDRIFPKRRMYRILSNLDSNNWYVCQESPDNSIRLRNVNINFLFCPVTAVAFAISGTTYPVAMPYAAGKAIGLSFSSTETILKAADKRHGKRIVKKLLKAVSHLPVKSIA